MVAASIGDTWKMTSYEKSECNSNNDKAPIVEELVKDKEVKVFGIGTEAVELTIEIIVEFVI